MDNTIFKRNILVFVLALVVIPLCGCSFSDVFGIVQKNTVDADSSGDSTKTVPKGKSKEPKITLDLDSKKVIYGLNEKPKALAIEAESPDGGVLSYQWYRNSTNSNGGGSAVSDADKAEFVPPTDTIGTSYYYVVVTNKRDGDYSAAYVVSSASCVVVQELTLEEEKKKEESEAAKKEKAEKEAKEAEKKANEDDNTGEWKSDDVGWRYEYKDGTYVKDDWKKINGHWYVFDDNGHMITGWHLSGKDWYYMGNDGVMVTSSVIDEDVVGKDGKWIPAKGETKPKGAE